MNLERATPPSQDSVDESGDRRAEELRLVRPLTLSQSVANRLTRYITANNLEPGASLPPQRELSELMGVSRPILRQAVAQLENEGLVTVRQGSGMYVLNRSSIEDPPAPPSHHLDLSAGFSHDLFSHTSASAVLEARMVIESELAALAAQRATSDDIARMEKDLEAIQEAARAGTSTNRATSCFHQSMAMAAHSPVLSAFLDQLTQPMRIGGLRIETALPDVLEAEGENHLDILNAVRTGDATIARRAMVDHLKKAHQWEESVEQLRSVETSLEQGGASSR